MPGSPAAAPIAAPAAAPSSPPMIAPLPVDWSEPPDACCAIWRHCASSMPRRAAFGSVYGSTVGAQVFWFTQPARTSAASRTDHAFAMLPLLAGPAAPDDGRATPLRRGRIGAIGGPDQGGSGAAPVGEVSAEELLELRDLGREGGAHLLAQVGREGPGAQVDVVPVHQALAQVDDGRAGRAQPVAEPAAGGAPSAPAGLGPGLARLRM